MKHINSFIQNQLRDLSVFHVLTMVVALVENLLALGPRLELKSYSSLSVIEYKSLQIFLIDELKYIYLFAPGFSCGTRDPQLHHGGGVWLPKWGIEPRPPALGVQSLSHWATREMSSKCWIMRLSFWTKRLSPVPFLNFEEVLQEGTQFWLHVGNYFFNFLLLL